MKCIPASPVFRIQRSGRTGALGSARRFAGVTAEPEVATLILRPEHDALVAATDGVWRALSNAQVQAKIRATVRHVDYGAKRIAADAWEAGSTDNIGAVCVYFGDEPERR